MLSVERIVLVATVSHKFVERKESPTVHWSSVGVAIIFARLPPAHAVSI